MAFTRFHDDPCRIAKELQEGADVSAYYLQVPGNGPAPPYMASPGYRLQQWGANLFRDPISVQNIITDRDRRLGGDCHLLQKVPEARPDYPTCRSGPAISRAIEPAFLLRCRENSYWERPLPRPGCSVVAPRPPIGLSARLAQRDQFVPSCTK